MCRSHSRGFALTEVLVAAALFAAGLLGHFALLVQGARTERAAADLATASTLAADMAERIRANPSAAMSYSFDPRAAPPAPAACALGAPFDGPARAACDIDEWLGEISAALPGAQAQLATMAEPDTMRVACMITIRWPAHDAGSSEYNLRLQV